MRKRQASRLLRKSVMCMNKTIKTSSLLHDLLPSYSTSRKQTAQLKQDRILFLKMGDLGSIPGLGRSPGEGYLLQYSGLENSMDCIVHGVAKSQTRLNNFHFSFPFKAVIPERGNTLNGAHYFYPRLKESNKSSFLRRTCKS